MEVEPFEWECGNTLGGGGEFSLDLLDLRWETGLRSSSGNDLWCGDHPLKVSFPELFNILLVVRRFGWLIVCSFLMRFFSGIYHLRDLCMIGRWTRLLHSLIFCILLGWDKATRKNLSDPLQ